MAAIIDVWLSRDLVIGKNDSDSSVKVFLRSLVQSLPSPPLGRIEVSRIRQGEEEMEGASRLKHVSSKLPWKTDISI